MAQHLAVFIPDEILAIIKRLIARDWLVTAFEAKGKDLYNPAGFLHNIELEGVNYKLYLDRNIFSYILASLKNEPTEFTRDAIALVAFCQFCKIHFEPSLAVYEKINYRKQIPDSVIEEINLFRKIDNSPTQHLISYALGLTNSYDLNSNNFIEDKTYLKHELGKYNRLTEWDSMYLFVLKLVMLDNDTTSKDNLLEIITWMHKEFRRSLVATVYALYLFSSKRKKYMIKYKSKASIEEKKNNSTI